MNCPDHREDDDLCPCEDCVKREKKILQATRPLWKKLALAHQIILRADRMARSYVALCQKTEGHDPKRSDLIPSTVADYEDLRGTVKNLLGHPRKPRKKLVVKPAVYQERWDDPS